MENIEKPKEEIKTLETIINEGYQWHNGLCTIIVDLCKRIKALEDKQ